MFAITNAPCQMGKINNNVEKHGDEDVPAWTIPLVGLLIDAHELEVLLHDGWASEAFFVRNAEDVLEPRPWTTYAKPVELTEVYDGMSTALTLGDRVVEFARCRLKDLTLGRYFSGGMVQLDCKLQLEPGLALENLLLQEFQNQPIALTVLDARVAAKKKLRQQELPLVQAGAVLEEVIRTANVGAVDPLYDAAVTFVAESRITSVSGLQAQLGIDYARASLLLGAMEVAGVVGSVRDDHSREILDGVQYGPGDEEPAPDPEPPDPGVWPMAAPDADVPTSRTGRAVTAHAKRQARKRTRAGKNGDARPH